MKCPKCGRDDARVIDSRDTLDKTLVRRRRLCIRKKCSHRWTTYEGQDMRGLGQRLLAIARELESIRNEIESRPEAINPQPSRAKVAPGTSPGA